jgi:hypothetical protein
MSKKKKQKKQKAPDKLLLSAEDKSRLETLLENLQDIDSSKIKEHIQSPEVAQALVQKMPPEHPNTVAILASLREAFDQKNVQKEIKRALFKLGRKGVRIPEEDQQGNTPFQMKRTDSDEPDVYLGPVDGSGGRVIFLAVPRIPKGYDIGMGVINDEHGFLEFVSGTYSKKQMKEVKAMFFEQVSPLIETSLSHAASVLESVHSRAVGGQTEATNNYLQLRPLILNKTSPLERPFIYDFLPSEEPDSLTDSRIQKLLSHKLLETWVVPPEEIRPLMEEITKTEESPLVMSEVQKTNRLDEIKDKALDDLYPDEKRALLKARLEEMSFVFYKLGEEEYARLSLAAALSLAEKDTMLRVNPFLKALLHRTLDLYFKSIKEMKQPEKEAEQEDSSKLILP